MTNINLTNAEWNVMECLWEKAPRSSREIVDSLRERIGWTKSTTLTMLKRMTEKGLITCESSQRLRMYTPCIDREKAVKKETENFLNRVYKGSVSLMINAMTQKQELSEDEIQELYEILKQSRTKAQS